MKNYNCCCEKDLDLETKEKLEYKSSLNYMYYISTYLG